MQHRVVLPPVMEGCYMKITHEIKMDLIHQKSHTIDLVQGCTAECVIRFRLLENNFRWKIPDDTSAMIQYRKPNGKSGVYDTLSDGSTAYRISADHIDVILAPDIISLPGEGWLAVSLVQMGRELSTFRVKLRIDANPCYDGSGDQGLSCMTGLLTAPEEAQVGQYLAVAEVNEAGKITKTAAMDMPEMSEAIRQYLEDNSINIEGSTGKSAYEYAVDGGYTGTEEEFSQKLAEETSILYITATGEGENRSVDRTMAEIVDAYQAGRPLYIVDEVYTVPLFASLHEENLWIFAFLLIDNTGMAYEYYLQGSIDGEMYVNVAYEEALAQRWEIPTRTSQLTNDTGFLTSAPVTSVNGKTGNITLDIPTVPDTLPNPSALSINGTSYDGSDAKELELATREQGIFYIEGTGDTAGTWLGVHDDITGYYPGLTVLYKVPVAGASATTLNINGLGAVPVVRNATTAISTTCPVNSVVMLTYTEDSGTAYWKRADYDANTKTTTGTSNKTGTKLYLAGATSQSSSGATTYSNANCYIGTDNRLYSGGAVVPNIAEITALIEEQLGVIENGAY